jgi:hypothetical protein
MNFKMPTCIKPYNSLTVGGDRFSIVALKMLNELEETRYTVTYLS